MAMEQHAVPQNISSYEFRLVGDMTLKQFLQLAAGVILAIIIYRLPIPGLLKYPFVAIVVVVGVVMAFVPVNNRPFNQWLTAFFKAIYAPTEYYWKPSVAETKTAPATPAPTPSPAQVIPSFTSYVKNAVAPDLPKENPVVESLTVESISSFPTPTQTVFSSAVKPLPPKIDVPVIETETKKELPEEKIPEPAPTGPLTFTSPVPPPTAPGPLPAVSSAVTTSSLPAPTQPNILSGLVTDFNGQALSGVTIEIIDQASGIPARALRTNRLGQFQIAIPLPAGTYTINPEKDDVSFEPVSVQVAHGIIQPIIISAKAI